jgi:hypothetical protein
MSDPAKQHMNPWDITPFSGHGDKFPNTTYEAVGRALSAWEELEVNLSHLFGVFSGKDPLSTETYASYGEERIFVQRADMLERLASSYFIIKPNQNLEGDFCHLICDTRCFSARRNDIAHGVVRPIQTYPATLIPVENPSDDSEFRIEYEWVLGPVVN